MARKSNSRTRRNNYKNKQGKYKKVRKTKRRMSRNRRRGGGAFDSLIHTAKMKFDQARRSFKKKYGVKSNDNTELNKLMKDKQVSSTSRPIKENIDQRNNAAVDKARIQDPDLYTDLDKVNKEIARVSRILDLKVVPLVQVPAYGSNGIIYPGLPDINRVEYLSRLDWYKTSLDNKRYKTEKEMGGSLEYHRGSDFGIA